MSKTICLRLNEQLIEQLKKIAKEENRTLNNLIETLLFACVKKDKKITL